MAGLCGLKTLLLWAGLAAVALCADITPTPAGVPQPPANNATPNPPNIKPSTAPPSPKANGSDRITSPTSIPATTPSISPADTAENQTSPPNTTSQNHTSPAATRSMTVTPRTPANISTTGTPATLCPFVVRPARFGFQLNLTSPNNGTYTVELTEKGTGSKETREFLYTTPQGNSSDPQSHRLKYLKPCTTYDLRVTFVDKNTNVTQCNQTLTEVTKDIETKDIGQAKCGDPAHVCYWSGWDLGKAIPRGYDTPAGLTCESNKLSQQVFCIKPSINEICSVLTTTFKCENRSVFSRKKDITLDFLDPSEIKQTTPTRLPAEIAWSNKPKRCNESLTIEYTCKERGKNQSYVLGQLEPYKNYTCNGQIETLNISTPNVSVNILCGVRINKIQRNAFKDSIKIQWNTTTENCQPAVYKNLSYRCCCSLPTSSPKCSITKEDQYDCQISGLDYYTEYKCTIQPRYNETNVDHSATTTEIRTEAGKPVGLRKLTVALDDNNAVTLKCEGPLKWNGKKEEYVVFLNGDEWGRNKSCCFTLKDLSYLTSYEVKVLAYNGQYESDVITTAFDTRYNDKAVIGILAFLIILTSVALLLVLYKIYVLQRRKSHNISERMELIPAANDEETLLNIEPIAAEALLDSYKRKIADDGRLFLGEFQSIPRIFTRNTVKEAKKPCNAYKNRYVDILPYDYNRVQLTSGNGDAGCDYINASFIDGFKECKKYIAAQGPKEETVGDFWRMIWEQQSSIIVMVTRCEEGNRIKCAQYWPTPDREAEIFEEFVVKLNGEDYCPDYIIRHLSLTNKRDKNTEREVTHIQFTSWPDHDVPGEPHLLLKLRRRVNAFKNFFSGPIVIHCSAGVGRTGTYISIDAMMEGLEVEGRVDIYGYIVQLRRQRCLMVQVEAQYILIHRALIEYNQFGETEIPLAELHNSLSTLRQTGSGTEPTLMEEEFQRLPKYKNWRTFNAGITEENKRKNRVSSVIPYDFNRVLVRLEEDSSHDSDHDDDDDDESSDEEDEEATKYINASHIDGYWCQRSFIAAQGPLSDTVADFWQMVYQKKAKAIVMLSDCSEDDTEMCCPYWGSERKTYGDIEVEVTATETSSTFTTRTMLIRHTKRKESRQVKQFHFLKWAGRQLPEKPQDLTDMIKNIKQACGYGNSKSDRSTPVVVHCSDGSSRSGVFCALWNLLDSAETEKLVDVFQVAKALRKERQDIITSQEQYHFLYDALEGAFPVQNGDVKAAVDVASDSVQMVNETKPGEPSDEAPAEKQAEQPAGGTVPDQQGAAESTPLVADGAKEEEKKEEGTAKEPPTEKTPAEETSNGPVVTLEV